MNTAQETPFELEMRAAREMRQHGTIPGDLQVARHLLLALLGGCTVLALAAGAMHAQWHEPSARDVMIVGAILLLALSAADQPLQQSRSRVLLNCGLFSALSLMILSEFGPIGASYFVLPGLAMIIAWFYPLGSTLVVAAIIAVLLGAIATGFVSGALVLAHGAITLQQSANGWLIYVGMVAIMLGSIVWIATRYRAGIESMVAELLLRERLLEQANAALADSITRARQLERLLSICAACKKFRISHDHWVPGDEYLSLHLDTIFERQICPRCQAKVSQSRAN